MRVKALIFSIWKTKNIILMKHCVKLLYPTTQHCTVQYNTVLFLLYCTVLPSTVQPRRSTKFLILIIDEILIEIFLTGDVGKLSHPPLPPPFNNPIAVISWENSSQNYKFSSHPQSLTCGGGWRHFIHVHRETKESNDDSDDSSADITCKMQKQFVKHWAIWWLID